MHAHRSVLRSGTVVVGPSAETPSLPAILSIGVVQGDEGGRGVRRAILLVYEGDVAAETVDASDFLVMYADGTRASVEHVTFGPADEADENRSVWLSVARRRALPEAVEIIGPLHLEDGRSVYGASALVRDPSLADTAVAAERRSPAPGRCEGASQVVRTYWTDVLRGVDAVDLAGVTITFRGGATAHAMNFDDDAEPLPRGDDNVLDVCVGGAGKMIQIEFAAGLFRDAEGHESARVRLPL